MNIAVLSRNQRLYSTRRLVEAIKAKGHNAMVLDHMKCDIFMDEEGPSIYYEGKNLKNQVDAVIPRIGASVTFYGTAVVRHFEMMKVFSAVDSLAITRSRDKLRSLQLLSRSGVGLPNTAFTNYGRNERLMFDHIGSPVVIKLLEGTQGLGVVLAETKKAAVSVIQAFESLKTRVILQEFIEEAGGADIRAFVVDGKIVGAMKRQGAEGDFRSNLHRGGKASVVRLSKDEKATALKAAKCMGLAIAGVDMLQSKKGPLVLEVNSSPGLEGIEKATEKDIAGAIVSYIERSVSLKRRPKDRIKA